MPTPRFVPPALQKVPLMSVLPVRLLCAVSVLLCLWLPRAQADLAPRPNSPSAAAAAPLPVGDSAAKPDAEGFVPDSRPPDMRSVEKGISAPPLVATAYGCIWLFVFGFVAFTLRRTMQLQRDLDELRQRIQQALPQKK
jgi:CcmD family protein